MNDLQQFACHSLCIQPAHASSNTSLPLFHATPDMSSPHFPSVEPSDIHEDTAIYEDNHDVEMVSNLEPGPSQPSQTSPATPNSSARSARRARVEDDDEDEDDLRASNRRRRHSRTLHDDEHRFMPIPEDLGVPNPNPNGDARAPPQPSAFAEPQPPQQGPAPPPQLNGMTWTFDFIPIRGPRQGTNVQAPDGAAPATGNDDNQHNHQHGQGWNFFINFQNPGEGIAPQPGAGGNQGSYNPIFASSEYYYPPFTDGGNQPGPGFALPFPPFVFPFGMDFLEQRDDPERAQRLVKGLEEVPAGLVKRMERVGGPGTGRGQVPTCAVCWEGLLDPEGGGFEGNAELARAEAAEAAEAAREEAASQQARESSENVDDSSPTMDTSAGSSSSSSQPSLAEEGSSPAADEDTQQPKIVVLPCAHAFHATCLLPWFSKPGRTTCPSCRFDIDPDSLTYKPPPLRPPRANPRPQAAPAAAAGPQPEDASAGPAPAAPQPPMFFGGPLPPPPPLFQFPAAPQPPPAPAPPAEAQNAPNPPHAAPAASQEPQPEQAQDEPGQQRQPLPPFVTFDISMIIPIYPGRNGGAAPPNNGGAQAPNANAAPAASTDPQGPQAAAAPPPPPPPPPPRTDNNGFRLDDTILQEAVRTTFERLLGRPLPPFVPHPPTQGAAPPPGDNNTNDGQPQWFTFSTGPLPGGIQLPPMPPLNAGMGMGMPPPAGAGVGGAPRHRSNPRRPVEKRPWAPPPAPGPTLRQVVERNEREMGLRCSDVSCGLGPSDEEPDPALSSAAHQVSISALDTESGEGKPVCTHTFHSACLVSAERVAGWGQEVAGGPEGADVEVSCPVCRAHGVISREKWVEGASALA